MVTHVLSWRASTSRQKSAIDAYGVSVFERILRRMQEKVRALEYVMSVHAEEEMEDDELSILDVEHAILTGEIIERQKDQETEEWKYLIAAPRGTRVDGRGGGVTRRTGLSSAGVPSGKRIHI